MLTINKMWLYESKIVLRDMDYAAPMGNHVTDNHASDFSCSQS